MIELGVSKVFSQFEISIWPASNSLFARDCMFGNQSSMMKLLVCIFLFISPSLALAQNKVDPNKVNPNKVGPNKVDLVQVNKSDREMMLYSNGQYLKAYRISLLIGQLAV